MYESLSEFTVSGTKALFVTEFKSYDVPSDELGPISFMDSPCIAEEIHPDGSVSEVIRIPAENTEDAKGYILFYVPPISEGSTRKIRREFRIEKEFARPKTLSTGYPDDSTLFVKRLAHEHQLTVTFRVLIDSDIHDVKITSDFAGLQDGGTTFLKRNPEDPGRTYYVSEFVSPSCPVQGTSCFKIFLQPTKAS